MIANAVEFDDKSLNTLCFYVDAARWGVDVAHLGERFRQLEEEKGALRARLDRRRERQHPYIDVGTLRQFDQVPELFPQHVCALVEVLLSDHPARDDALICAVELSANAIAHTASGRGGAFVLEVWLSETQAVRIMVRDAGGTTLPLPRVSIDDDMSEGGRGLVIVAALSASTGMEGNERGRAVWADLDPRAQQQNFAGVHIPKQRRPWSATGEDHA